jgi:polysaccharide pyruvyl transferase WcaK-like protein
VRADAVVVAGGTIFKTLHPASGRPPLALLRRTALLAAMTKALRRPLALVGVGAGALHGGAARRLARTIVRAADLLVLRDEESAADLATIGAPTPFRVGADPAWTILPDPPDESRPAAGADPAVRAPSRSGESRPAAGGQPAVVMRGPGGGRSPLTLDGAAGDRPIVVALSHLAGGRDLGERLAAGLAPVVAAGAAVRLDPWQPSHDAPLADEVASRLGGRVEVAEPPADLLAARAGMADVRLVVAQRFHALVAAASAGVPALAVAHEPKLAGLARRLGQPTIEPEAPPAAIAAAITDALDGEPPSPEAVRHERASAAEGFRLLRVLLARGRSEEAADIDGLALRPEEWLG